MFAALLALVTAACFQTKSQSRFAAKVDRIIFSSQMYSIDGRAENEFNTFSKIKPAGTKGVEADGVGAFLPSPTTEVFVLCTPVSI